VSRGHGSRQVVPVVHIKTIRWRTDDVTLSPPACDDVALSHLALEVVVAQLRDVVPAQCHVPLVALLLPGCQCRHALLQAAGSDRNNTPRDKKKGGSGAAGAAVAPGRSACEEGRAPGAEGQGERSPELQAQARHADGKPAPGGGHGGVTTTRSSHGHRDAVAQGDETAAAGEAAGSGRGTEGCTGAAGARRAAACRCPSRRRRVRGGVLEPAGAVEHARRAVQQHLPRGGLADDARRHPAAHDARGLQDLVRVCKWWS